MLGLWSAQEEGTQLSVGEAHADGGGEALLPGIVRLCSSSRIGHLQTPGAARLPLHVNVLETASITPMAATPWQH